MKKIIYGLMTTGLSSALAIAIWSVVSPMLEMEGAIRQQYTSAVSLISTLPVAVYLLHSLYVRCILYRDRNDTKAYQPLKRPMLLLMNLALQSVSMSLYCNVFNTTDKVTLFPIIMVCLCGFFGLAFALVIGRPVPGKTRFLGHDL